MGEVIGLASDFYRLRLVRVDDAEAPDLQWREDILYRRPPTESPDEYEVYRLEAVSLDDDESLWPAGSFTSSDEARAALSKAEEALGELTKSEFDRKYLLGR